MKDEDTQKLNLKIDGLTKQISDNHIEVIREFGNLPCGARLEKIRSNGLAIKTLWAFLLCSGGIAAFFKYLGG